MQRVWSKFTVKSSSDGARIIEGIATTPSLDSSADIVEPKGAIFSLPLPVLAAHDSSKPVGQVISADVTARGISVRIKLAQVDAPPGLKERLDTAWGEIRAGLCRGLSIGFSPIEYEPIKNTFGVRYTRWMWRELSLVVVPSNLDATISSIKAADRLASTRGSARGSIVASRADPRVAQARIQRIQRERAEAHMRACWRCALPD